MLNSVKESLIAGIRAANQMTWIIYHYGDEYLLWEKQMFMKNSVREFKKPQFQEVRTDAQNPHMFNYMIYLLADLFISGRAYVNI
jgi:hypothetical protein